MSILTNQAEQLKIERLENARARRTESRERAGRLEADADSRHRRNFREHTNGEHIGTRADETGCLDCKNWGDLPLLGIETMTPEEVTQLRAFLLERNAVATVEAMRANSAFAALERELSTGAEVDE